MSGRIRPGMLCWVVNSRCGNNGRVVEVVCPNPGSALPNGATYEYGGVTWRQQNEGVISWIVEAKGPPLNDAYGSKHRRRPAHEDQLVPLLPPPFPETTETDDRAPCEVDPTERQALTT